MAQSFTIANLSAGNRSFRAGVRGVCIVGVLIGQHVIAHARSTSVINPPEHRFPASPRIQHQHPSTNCKPNDSEASTTSRTHVADGERKCRSFIVSKHLVRRPSSACLRMGVCLDVTHDYRALPPPLSSPQDGYAHGEYAYASHHSSGASLSGLQYTLPTMAAHPVPHHYEHEPSLLDDLNGFSPIAPNYNMNAYRTPYPDSNATSTSSATSPDAQFSTDTIIVEADEDKRKRNQAASARFRQKKKQREQQLMETTREMQDRTKKLEKENEGLKKENMFLKKLLVEKVDHMTEDDREMLRKAAGVVLERKK
ncbi:hypothetical protein HBI56_182530 [Parastagonospora nodorum]|nr:hypothetical protein HBH56_187940 [Parastagonospora nodorum]KAH3953171.1 hypothetical protein HBH53_035400 [Parastagonospora nodorum]KAH3959180.1 hypothetical protein HBH52_246460 [Parastagonospora nodorum]KAH3984230.1 hypothetical protein HBH51_025530 [Parastagonospora nodorum]KAH3991071.1 hypothetical protein HBI10_239200 [Parastagonospora nodorum]